MELPSPPLPLLQIHYPAPPRPLLLNRCLPLPRLYHQTNLGCHRRRAPEPSRGVRVSPPFGPASATARRIKAATDTLIIGPRHRLWPDPQRSLLPNPSAVSSIAPCLAFKSSTSKGVILGSVVKFLGTLWEVHFDSVVLYFEGIIVLFMAFDSRHSYGGEVGEAHMAALAKDETTASGRDICGCSGHRKMIIRRKTFLNHPSPFRVQ